jgi:hypothetical protein
VKEGTALALALPVEKSEDPSTDNILCVVNGIKMVHACKDCPSLAPLFL